MFKFLKELKGLPKNNALLAKFIEEDLQKRKEESKVTLLRHLLGSIDLSDIENKEVNQEERKEYCAKVASFFSTLQEGIKELVRAQEQHMARTVTGIEQFEIGRGTINGILLVEEYFQKLRDEHFENVKPQETFDRKKVVAELEVKQ